MIFYLGIVRLPSIKDYWDTQQYIPDRKIAKEPETEKEAEKSDEDDKEEGTLYDESMECIVHDKDDSDEEDESEDDDNKDTDTESDDNDENPQKCGISS
eukprot:11591138-Ditylum_brightwellii.AAC.1